MKKGSTIKSTTNLNTDDFIMNRIGIAKGKILIPEDFDSGDEEIEKLFEISALEL